MRGGRGYQATPNQTNENETEDPIQGNERVKEETEMVGKARWAGTTSYALTIFDFVLHKCVAVG